ncbi:MAG: peptidylprolyl isomerase [Rikenellaceae bacterium]
MKVEMNKMVAVDYTLTVDGNVADKSQEGAPLQFIIGSGMILPKFEEAIMGKEVGDKVAFTLDAADGYGEPHPEAIVDLPRAIFCDESGQIAEMVQVGNVLPMSSADGQQMPGTVVEIGEETVKMDFNHPMAGKTLNFEVEVVMVRDVTPEDLAPQGGCGCGCGEGEGDCEDKGCDDKGGCCCN